MIDIRARYTGLADPLLTERRVELAVVALLLLLLLQLCWGTYRVLVPATAEPVRPTADSLQVAALQAAPAVAEEAREEIRARPLFWEGRRPVDAVAAAPKQPEPEKPKKEKEAKLDGVQLSGVFGSGDEAGMIVVVKGKKRRVMVGDEVNGWRLDTVDPVRATLSNNGRQAELRLKRGTITVVEVSEPPPAASDQNSGKKSKKPAAGKPKAADAVKNEQSSGGLSLGGGATNSRDK